MRCPDCGGSGLLADAHGDAITDAEREMLDSTRCYTCCGDGQVGEVSAAFGMMDTTGVHPGSFGH